MIEVDYQAIQLEVARLFDYVPDSVQFDRPEDWRSHADAVRRGERFQGDCDDYALTCAELLVEDGADPSETAIVYCKTENDVAHLACLYRSWILDNRHDWPVDWSRIGYDYISAMYLSAPGEWREIVNS